jgi:hypothetical protein
MPTVVVRQKALTSNHYRKGKPVGESKSKVDKAERKIVSRHLEMPRWRIAPELITDINLGRDEAARINYVQIYTRTISTNDQKNRAAQTGLGNYVVDIEDIERHGLRPYIATAQFDLPENDGNKVSNKGREWAQLVADFLIGGHLREAGTIQLMGVEEPISVGDKLQLGYTVFEIDAVNHTMAVAPNGKKMFRTNLQVSFGMDIRSNQERPVYPEMDHTDAHTMRVEEFTETDGGILPGVSDTQDIPNRTSGEETEETSQQTFTQDYQAKKGLVDPTNRSAKVEKTPTQNSKKRNRN